MTPKVTYIMPTIRSRFIGKALDSVVNQTLQEWEMFIFNSNPVREFAVSDERMTVINMFNLPTEMINVGIQMANSDVILHMADDDEDLPDRAQTVYDEIQGGVDIFCGSSTLINEKDEEVGFQGSIYEEPREKAVYTHGALPLQAGGYRKSTCPKWSNEFYYLCDTLFFIEAFEKGLTIKCSPVILSKVRQWSKNISASSISAVQARRSETFRLRKMFGPTVRCKVLNTIMHLPPEAFE